MGKKFGVSFSWKRAVGISGAKGKISRTTGIPLTRQGRQRKIGSTLGCCIPITIFITILVIVVGISFSACSSPSSITNDTNIHSVQDANLPSNTTTNLDSNIVPSKPITNIDTNTTTNSNINNPPSKSNTNTPTTTITNPSNVPSIKSTNTQPCSGATAICRDGSCSYSAHRQGTCSHHGGVAKWLE